MELVRKIANEAAQLRPFLPTYLHLLASALFPIYVGAHASLSIPSSAAPPAKKKIGPYDDDFSDEQPEIVAGNVEGLTPKDAVLFPLLAGFTLSSLYFIIKWLEDPSTLNKILSYYFLQVGLVFGTKFLKDGFTIMRSICLPIQYEQGGRVWKVNRLKKRTSPFPGRLGRASFSDTITKRTWRIRGLLYAKLTLNFHIYKLITLKFPVDLLDALALITSSSVVGIFTFVYKPWYISNLLGFAFCYGSTQLMSPTTFWTGTLLLSALFIYDIYFVFFTPMMVTVATKLDVPIKLLFPRPSSLAEAEKGLTGLAMLGLGDIVIPGMMIALALRFDLYLHYLRSSKIVDGKVEKAVYIPVTGGWGERFWVGRSAAGPDLRGKSFPKTYFKAGLVGYASGMIVTLLVMQIAEHAQPALLYLVPGVLSALWGTAAIKGDLDLMWNYTEDNDVAKAKSSSNEQKQAAKGRREETQEGRKTNSSNEAEETPKTTESKEISSELEFISTTTDKNPNSTPDTKADPEASSNLNSSSASDSDTPLSSQSDHKDHLKQEGDNPPKKEEQKNRHLIWFSIDLPSPPQSPQQPESASQDKSARFSTSPSSSDTGRAADQEKVAEEATHDAVSAKDGEPPGKRRRVE